MREPEALPNNNRFGQVRGPEGSASCQMEINAAVVSCICLIIDIEEWLQRQVNSSAQNIDVHVELLTLPRGQPCFEVRIVFDAANDNFLFLLEWIQLA